MQRAGAYPDRGANVVRRTVFPHPARVDDGGLDSQRKWPERGAVG